jgi:hypothetical protein
VGGVADEHDVVVHPGVEGDLFDRRDVDERPVVEGVEQGGGGFGELGEQRLEAFGRVAVDLVEVGG